MNGYIIGTLPPGRGVQQFALRRLHESLENPEQVLK